MRLYLISATGLALAMAACASPTEPAPAPEVSAFDQWVASVEGDYGVSAAAMATAVRDADGKPVGLGAYEAPIDAIEAGDMAAFIAMVRLAEAVGDAPDGVGGIILAVDRIADEDYAGARTLLENARGSSYTDPIVDYIDAWIYALDGEAEQAISAHRGADNALPGLTAELSLAAMLEAFGRKEEALAVYSAMTPREIEAPEHEFDPKGILFTHVQLVISRKALLLRRMGRIEEAQEAYRRLAEAEPEEAAFYAAAMEALATGRGLDDTPLTTRSAFARSMSDLSLALYQERLIQNALLGRRLRGLDEQRATFDQLALLLDPANENLRELVIDSLYQEAFYDGAAHVALSAPEPTARLQISAAQAFLMSGRQDDVRGAIVRALDLVEEDEKLATLIGAVGMHALMGDELRTLELVDAARTAAGNDAERASTAALKASVLQQFGRAGEAVVFAQQAAELDNTHARRMALASILGDAGRADEGLQIILRDRLKRPNDPYMLNTHGYFLIEHTDRYAEAYRILARASALAENDPYITDSLGWAYYKLGHLDEALRLIERARRELAPQYHWEIEHHLGDIYWHLGRPEEARQAWRNSLGEFPPAHVRDEIETKLEQGITTPPPAEQPVPRVSLEQGEITERET